MKIEHIVAAYPDDVDRIVEHGDNESYNERCSEFPTLVRSEEMRRAELVGNI